MGGSGCCIQVRGPDPQLVAQLTEPPRRALTLGARHGYYEVRVNALGREGEVLLRIDGIGGHVPLLRRDQWTDGYVFAAVQEAVRRVGL